MNITHIDKSVVLYLLSDIILTGDDESINTIAKKTGLSSEALYKLQRGQTKRMNINNVKTVQLTVKSEVKERLLKHMANDPKSPTIKTMTEYILNEWLDKNEITEQAKA